MSLELPSSRGWGIKGFYPDQAEWQEEMPLNFNGMDSFDQKKKEKEKKPLVIP